MGSFEFVTMKSGPYLLGLMLTVLVLSFGGCATGKSEAEKKDDFFTSGSPEADRRAESVVPKAEDGAEERTEGKEGEEAEKPKTLYVRLGEEEGIQRIVEDFIQRALEDPRVNWTRKGVTKRSWFRTQKVEEWQPTAVNLERLKLHFVQFISLAAGGPAQYEGKPLRPAHLEMQITKAEFDATIGDLKATLDKLQIAPDVQKDLLSIFESARQQIVMER